MGDSEQNSKGLLSSLRNLLETGLAGLQNRIELFAVELREEKCRLIEILLWATAAVFLGMMAVTFVTLAIVIYFWPHARVAALIGVSLFYVATALAAFYGLRTRLTKGPLPFDDTLREIKKDRECLRSQK